MLRKWASIKCLASGNDTKLSQWMERPLLPITGTRLALLGSKHCTQRKTELVMDGNIGRRSYEVRCADGRLWYKVERKSLYCWSRRVIWDFEGMPVCFLERSPKSGNIELWSLEESVPSLVMDIEDLKSKTGLGKKNELRITLKGKKSYSRQYIRVGGNLDMRMFSVSWSDDPKTLDLMVAMTWSLFKDKGDDSNSARNFVMELPAGVDAAAMVAIAISLEERNEIPLPAVGPQLESLSGEPMAVFGEGLVTHEQDIFVLACGEDRISVINSSGDEWLVSRENGRFQSRTNESVFQLAERSFKARGTDLCNKPIDITFLESGGDGSFFRLALQCSSSCRKGFRAVVIATMRTDEEIVTFELIRKFSKGQKIDRSSLMNSTFPIIATAVLGSKNPESFENWYYDSIDSQSRTTTCSNQSIQHLGIGFEVAGGVDVALILSALMVTIKFLPASFSCAARTGEICPRGATQMKANGTRSISDKSWNVNWLDSSSCVPSDLSYLLASRENLLSSEE